MRKIKFRLRQNKKIVGYENWWFTDEWLYRKIDSDFWDDCLHHNFIKHNEKDGFIGLHDKNGKEIYEGDFITINGILHQVEWSDEEASFYAYELYGGSSYYFGREKDEIIVVGNIYENSELLGENED